MELSEKWAQELARAAVQPGWDGPGSIGTDAAALEAAGNVIKRLVKTSAPVAQLAPEFDGGLTFYWNGGLLAGNESVSLQIDLDEVVGPFVYHLVLVHKEGDLGEHIIDFRSAPVLARIEVELLGASADGLREAWLQAVRSASVGPDSKEFDLAATDADVLQGMLELAGLLAKARVPVGHVAPLPTGGMGIYWSGGAYRGIQDVVIEMEDPQEDRLYYLCALNEETPVVESVLTTEVSLIADTLLGLDECYREG